MKIIIIIQFVPKPPRYYGILPYNGRSLLENGRLTWGRTFS
jgi:hypothetical protein